MRENVPSTTAIKIARGLYSLGRTEPYARVLPAGLVETSERLLSAAGLLEPWMERIYESGIYRGMLRVSNRLNAGLVMHMVLRKRIMDDLVREALGAGAVQVLVVGAGFDTLCIRLAEEHPELLAVEVDHPATHALKERGVDTAGLRRPNLHMLGADLSRRDLVEVLGELPEWDPKARSVVVAEGLLMYLDEAAVQRFLRSLKEVMGEGSRLAFSYLPSDERGRIGGAHFGWALRTTLSAIGERLKWGPRTGTLASFLAEEGFRLLGPEGIDLHARYFAGTDLEALRVSEAERVALAEL